MKSMVRHILFDTIDCVLTFSILKWCLFEILPFSGTLFTEVRPLWVCENAFNITHHCRHVLCTDCYKTPERGSDKSNKRVKASGCRHKSLNSLNPYSDPEDLLYLHNKYPESKKLPNRCAQCKHIILVNGAPIGMNAS